MIATILCTLFSLHLNLWLDREEAVYYPTETIKIFFRVDKDCFVAIYNIDKGGKIKRLFPPQGYDGWVEAGKRYQLPPPEADYEYEISGPPGVETIIGRASTTHLPEFSDEGLDVVESVIEVEIRETEPARLIIVSRPKRARVYITETETEDEEYAGRTPRVVVLRPGEYWVKIRKPGYQTLRRMVWLEPGEVKKVFVRLRPY